MKQGGARDALVVLVVVVALLMGVSAMPEARRFLWRKARTFPDLQALERQIATARVPWRGVSRRLIENARGELEKAKRTDDLDAKTALLALAQRDAAYAMYMLHLPMVVVWALGVGVMVARIRQRSRTDVNIEDETVGLDLSVLEQPLFELPESPLPSQDVAQVHVNAWKRIVERERASAEIGAKAAAVDGTDAEPRFADVWRSAMQNGSKSRATTAQLAKLSKETTAEHLAIIDGGVAPWLLDVREELRRRELLGAAHERVFRILAAYPRHPASTEIGEHGWQEGGLIAHTVAVVRAALALVDARAIPSEQARLVVLACLLHDIGKIVSLQENPGQKGDGSTGWTALDWVHAQNGALIARSLPEVWDEIRVAPEVEQEIQNLEKVKPEAAAVRRHEARAWAHEAFLLVLWHDHDPDNLPLNHRSSAGPLMGWVQKADRQAVGGEVRAGVLAAGVTAHDLAQENKEIQKAVHKAVQATPIIIANMNINRSFGDRRPDGVYEGERKAKNKETGETTTKESVLLILESKFRDELREYLDVKWPEAVRILGLHERRIPGRTNRGWKLVAAALQQCGALLPSVRDVPIDPSNALLTARVGKVDFFGAFPLSLRWLGTKLGGEFMEGLLTQWALREDFPIEAIVTGTSSAAVEALRAARTGGNKEEGNKNRHPEPGRWRQKKAPAGATKG